MTMAGKEATTNISQTARIEVFNLDLFGRSHHYLLSWVSARPKRWIWKVMHLMAVNCRPEISLLVVSLSFQSYLGASSELGAQLIVLLTTIGIPEIIKSLLKSRLWRPLLIDTSLSSASLSVIRVSRVFIDQVLGHLRLSLQPINLLCTVWHTFFITLLINLRWFFWSVETLDR